MSVGVVFIKIVFYSSLLVFLLYLFQDKFIYFPSAYTDEYKLMLEEQGITPLQYMTSSGSQTAFYWHKNMTDSKAIPKQLWVLFAGNGSLALDWTYYIENFPKSNVAFLLIDYPSYGFCEGKPTQASIRGSSQEAFRTLANHLGTNVEELTKITSVMGHSLGAATALIFTESYRASKLILLSPFTSMIDMAKLRFGSLIGRLLKDNYDNVARLKIILSRTDKPQISVVHGAKDEVIPVWMSRKINSIFKGQVKYIELSQASHNRIIKDYEPLITKLMTDD